jgi:flavin reductase (DIM6/NTAB) family NADH-FMN oxidoreductase RutF
LDARSKLLALVRDAGAFGINILASGQEDLALTFARGGTDEFDRVSWTLDHGAPRLDGVSGWVMCRLDDLLPGGDHLIAVGHVVHAEARDAEPLLYRRHTFRTLAGLPAS